MHDTIEKVPRNEKTGLINKETKEGVEYLRKIIQAGRLKGKKSFKHIESPVKQMISQQVNTF